MSLWTVFVAAILVSVSSICEATSVGLSLWSYEDVKTVILHYTIKETNHCFSFGSCLESKISFATWTSLPSDTKIVFYANLECKSAGIVYDTDSAGNVNFNQKFGLYSFILVR